MNPPLIAAPYLKYMGDFFPYRLFFMFLEIRKNILLHEDFRK